MIYMSEEIDILDMLCANEGISITNKEIANFNQLIQGVHLGPIFEELCIDEEWDKLFVKESLIKYALHQIKQESMKLNYEEKIRVEDYSADEIDGIKLSSILEETHFSDPSDYYKTFGDKILSSFSLKKRLDVKELTTSMFGENMPYKYDDDDYTGKSGIEFNEAWHSHSLKSGSFFPLYKTCEVLKAKKALAKAHNNLSPKKMKRFIAGLLEHYNKYLRMLQMFPDDYDATEDLLRLEEFSDLFFLLKAIVLLKKDDWFLNKNKNRRTEILKVISSFVIIEDIRIKLHILENFIEEGAAANYTSTEALGYLPLFRLLFVQLPLLKQKLVQIIDNKEVPLANSLRGRQIKIKLKRYAFLKQAHCYRMDYSNYFLSEEDISIVQSYIQDTENNDYDQIFYDLYKEAKEIRNVADEVRKCIELEMDDSLKQLKTIRNLKENINWRVQVELVLREQVQKNVLPHIKFTDTAKSQDFIVYDYLEESRQ